MEWISKIMEFFKAEWVEALLVFLFMSVEYFLGKTSLVKSGSVLEIVLNSIKKILEFLKVKKPS